MARYKALAGVATNPGNFYRELGVLHKAGLVVPTEAGEEQKTIPYCITAAGEREFDGWLCDPLTPESPPQMSTWILFAGRVPREVGAEILDRLRNRIWLQSKAVEQARVDALRAARNRAEPGRQKYDPAPLLLLRELKHLTADLEFLEELRMALESNHG